MSDYEILQTKYQTELDIIEHRLDANREQQMMIDADNETLIQRKGELSEALGRLTMGQVIKFIGSPESEPNPWGDDAA